MDDIDFPVGIQVWIPGQDLRSCLETAFKMWVKENPYELIAFRKYMINKRDSLHRKDGMSKNGTWKEYLEIPYTLSLTIQKMTNKDWMLDRKITDMVKKVMPDFLCYQKNESSVIMGGE